MWLAHALTLSRIPIAVALCWVYGDRWIAASLIALAAATDAADGNVARYLKRHGHTHPDIGGWLDPLVDKIFVAIVLGVVWLATRDIAVIVLVGARELLLLPLAAIYVARRAPVGQLHADPIGKAATIAQFVALCVAILAPAYALPLAVIAAILGIAAAAHYIARDLRHPPSAAF